MSFISKYKAEDEKSDLTKEDEKGESSGHFPATTEIMHCMIILCNCL